MSIGQVLFSFQGRIGRSDYWLKGWLPLLGLAVCLAVLVGLMVSIEGPAIYIGVPLLAAGFVLMAWAEIALFVKRLHDMNHSGWWWLLAFIPGVSIVMLVVLGVMVSYPADNRFGLRPGQS